MVYTMYGILGIWLQSLHNSLILNALPVPMLRQVFFEALKAWYLLWFSNILRKLGFFCSLRVQARSWGASWRCFGRLFESFWATLGRLWEHFGGLGASFSLKMGAFSGECSQLGPKVVPGDVFYCFWEPSGDILGLFSMISRHGCHFLIILGDVLGACQGFVFEGFCRVLWATWLIHLQHSFLFSTYF